MALSAPSIRGGLSPTQLEANQAAQKGEITPEAAALNALIKDTPEYKAYQDVLQRPATLFEQGKVRAALNAKLSSLQTNIPDSVIFDPYTGQFREKNWNEAHSNLSALAYIGATTGAGLAAGAAVGALAGSGAASSAAAPALEGTAAGTGATTTAAGLGTAPIAAETGATTGIASGAGLPGAVAAPTVGDLATGGSAIAGTNLATDTVAANTPGMLSKTLSTLTQPSVLSTIASGAFSAYGANQAAGAQTDAAKIVADANTAAAKIQSDAAIQAAQIQAKSTAAALDFAKSGYNNQIGAYNTNQQQLAPYTGAGDAAVTKLSQLLGLGTPSASFTPLQPVPTTATAQQQTGVQSMQRPGTAAQQASADAFASNAVQNSPALSAVPQTPGPNAGSIASLAPQQSGAVTMRAPDGSVRQVPMDHVPQVEALGAQRVSA